MQASINIPPRTVALDCLRIDDRRRFFGPYSDLWEQAEEQGDENYTIIQRALYLTRHTFRTEPQPHLPDP